MSSGTAYVTTYSGELSVLLAISTSEHYSSTAVGSMWRLCRGGGGVLDERLGIGLEKSQAAFACLDILPSLLLLPRRYTSASLNVRLSIQWSSCP